MSSPSQSPFRERFREAVEAARKAGVSEKQLASRIGCSKNMIGYWKTGKHFPQHRHARAISRVLNIPADEFFERPEETKTAAERPVDPSELLSRLAEFELDTILGKMQEARPYLRQLDSSIPDLLDLLAEVKRRVEGATGG